MGYLTVTNENFEELKAKVLDGSLDFYVPTYTRITKITAKNLKAWDAAGLRLVYPSGDGFRMAQGKNTVYLFPGQLVAY